MVVFAMSSNGNQSHKHKSCRMCIQVMPQCNCNKREDCVFVKQSCHKCAYYACKGVGFNGDTCYEIDEKEEPSNLESQLRKILGSRLNLDSSSWIVLASRDVIFTRQQINDVAVTKSFRNNFFDVDVVVPMEVHQFIVPRASLIFVKKSPNGLSFLRQLWQMRQLCDMNLKNLNNSLDSDAIIAAAIVRYLEVTSGTKDPMSSIRLSSMCESRMNLVKLFHQFAIDNGVNRVYDYFSEDRSSQTNFSSLATFGSRLTMLPILLGPFESFTCDYRLPIDHLRRSVEKNYGLRVFDNISFSLAVGAARKYGVPVAFLRKSVSPLVEPCNRGSSGDNEVHSSYSQQGYDIDIGLSFEQGVHRIDTLLHGKQFWVKSFCDFETMRFHESSLSSNLRHLNQSFALRGLAEAINSTYTQAVGKYEDFVDGAVTSVMDSVASSSTVKSIVHLSEVQSSPTNSEYVAVTTAWSYLVWLLLIVIFFMVCLLISTFRRYLVRKIFCTPS